MSRSIRALALALLLAALVWLPGSVSAQTGDRSDTAEESAAAAAEAELTPAKAAAIGVVEGVTEYLPISSTGHLLITGELLDVGTSDATEDAFDAYAIAIQAGAILAVLVLYHERIRSMVLGVFGRDEVGRRIAIAVVTAFVPAVVIGLTLEDVIKQRLFNVWAIAAAWFVGGVVVIVISKRFLDRRAQWADEADPTPDDAFDAAASDETDRGGLASITVNQALIIGVAQCLAMWPGTSRSLVTIVAAVLVGLSLPAAVEFSFLLGLLTLGGATAYESLKSGGEIVDTFGVVNPLIGFVAAFVSAVIAVRWMVGYLQRHSFAIFGWYRVGIAGLTVVLVATGVISA